MAINQKHGVPRYPGGSPLAIRRSYFLGDDYKQKCFYGPTQRPDSGDQEQFNTDYVLVSPFLPPLIPQVYLPPADWMPAGKLLRVPQVVFLTRHFGTENIVVVGDLAVPYGAEEDRIDALFFEVESRITALRPGRTFIKHWGNWQAFSNNLDGPPWYFAMINTIDHLLAPPLTETEYLGTDFLHVFAGLPFMHVESVVTNGLINAGIGFSPIYLDDSLDIAENYPSFKGIGVGDGFLHATSDNIVFAVNLADPNNAGWGDGAGGFLGPIVLKPDPTDNPSFNSSLERLTAAYPNFRGYKALVYAPRVDGQGVDFLDVADDPPEPDDPAKVLIWIDALTLSNTHADGLGSYLRNTCGLATDFGVEFKGPSTDIDSADTLVGLIADHFGFDPVTGKDL